MSLVGLFENGRKESFVITSIESGHRHSITGQAVCVVHHRPGSLHLAGEVLLLNLDNVFARHNHQPQVAVDEVHLHERLAGCFALGSGLGALCGRGLAVFVGVLEDEVAVLYRREQSDPHTAKVTRKRERGRGEKDPGGLEGGGEKGAYIMYHGSCRHTGSVHLNSPQNILSSVVCTRSFLLRRLSRNSCAWALSICAVSSQRGGRGLGPSSWPPCSPAGKPSASRPPSFVVALVAG